MRHHLCGLTALAIFSFAVSACGQENPATQEPQQKESLRGLRQPGDDVTTDLKDPLETADKKKAESVAAYMLGVSEQKKGNLKAAEEAFQRAIGLDGKAAEPYKALALLMMRLGREREARDAATKAVERDEDDFQMRLQLALLVRRSGNPEDAIKHIEDALKSKALDKWSEDAVRIHTIRGAMYLDGKNIPEAVKSYAVLLDALERPEDFNLNFRRHEALMTDRATGYEPIGRIMLQVGRYDDAVRAFEGLARLREGRPGIHHFLLAMAQFRKDDLEGCEKNLNRYFETSRREPASLVLLTDLYKATDRGDQITKRFEELAEDSPDRTIVQMQLGNYQLLAGNSKAAQQAFERVLLDSADAGAHLGLIRVAIADRDAAETVKRIQRATRARISLEEIERLAPLFLNDPEFAKQLVAAALKNVEDKTVRVSADEYFLYSEVARKVERPDDQATLLQAALDANPSAQRGLQILSGLGFNQMMRDEYPSAIATYQRVLSIPQLPDRERLDTLYRLGQAQLFGDEIKPSIRTFNQALGMVPGNTELTYWLGLSELEDKQYELAETHLRQAFKGSNGNSELKFRAGIMLAGLHSEKHEWTKAARAYEQVKKIPDLDDEQVRRLGIGLSNAYVKGGDLQKGLKTLEKVYEASPDDPGVNNDLGYLYAENNMKLKKAEKMIRLAVEAEPENAAYQDSLGWVLYRLEKYDEALEAMKKATANEEDEDATLLEHLGDVYQALKKPEEAKKAWQRSLEVEQESPQADDEILKRLQGKLKPSDD